MSWRYKAGTRRARFAGENLDPFCAAVIPAFSVFAPEPCAHRVVERQSMTAKYPFEALEKRLGLLGRGGGRFGFADQLDEFFSQPGEQSFAHDSLLRMKRPISATGRYYISA
jgi:hypothetical protein